MTFEFIAAAIESIFYAGRPKADKKLDRRDFIELAKMANGTIMRKLYYEERQLDQEFWYFSSQVSTKEFDLTKKDSQGRVNVVIKDDTEEKKLEGKLSGIIRLPRGLGIFSVRPIDYDGFVQYNRGQVGGEWLYLTKPYRDTAFWIQKTHKLVLFNSPDCVKKIEVDGVWNEDNLDLPFDIAFDVVNAVLGLALKAKGFPVDKNNDNNPNDRVIRNALSETGAIQ